MPIENETKYVLEDPDGRLRETLARTIRPSHVEQFYTTPNNRFRSTTTIVDGRTTIRRQHAFKQMVGSRLLEIETEIPAADLELARGIAVERVVKTRFSFDHGETRWDVDFLLDDRTDAPAEVYLTVAEVEFEEGHVYAIPEAIRPHVAYQVPRELSHLFTNRLLADRKYAGRWRDVVSASKPEADVPEPEGVTTTPYETDFVTWTREQASLLRSRPDGSSPLDVENLAEEIEGAGRAAVATMSGQIRRLLVSLIWIALDPEAGDAGDHVEEALRHRADAMEGLMSGLDRHVDLSLIWRLARRHAPVPYGDGTALPEDCPLTIGSLLTEDFDPRGVATTLKASIGPHAGHGSTSQP